MNPARQLVLEQADLQTSVLSPRAARILACFQRASTVTEVALASGCDVPAVYELVQALRRDRQLLRCGHRGYIATATVTDQPAATLPPAARMYAQLTDTPTDLRDLAEAASVPLSKTRTLCTYLAAQGLARKAGPRSYVAASGESPAQDECETAGLATPDRILLVLDKPLFVHEIAAAIGMAVPTIRRNLRDLRRQCAVTRVVGAVYACSDWVAAQGGMPRVVAWFEGQNTPEAAALALRLARRIKRPMPRTSPVADRLCALLAEPKRPIELRSAVGLPIPTITGHMRALITKGKVVRLSRGLYLRADRISSPAAKHGRTAAGGCDAPALVLSRG